ATCTMTLPPRPRRRGHERRILAAWSRRHRRDAHWRLRATGRPRRRQAKLSDAGTAQDLSLRPPVLIEQIKCKQAPLLGRQAPFPRGHFAVTASPNAAVDCVRVAAIEPFSVAERRRADALHAFAVCAMAGGAGAGENRRPPRQCRRGRTRLRERTHISNDR